MSVYRTQVKIVADVLTSINDGSEGESGLGITRIIQKANLSQTVLLIPQSKLEKI